VNKMDLKYKNCDNGTLFGLGPLNGYSLRVFYRKVKNTIIFDPKKITNQSFDHIFGEADTLDFEQDANIEKIGKANKEGFGQLCGTIREYPDWDPKTYQGEVDNIIRSGISRFFEKIAKDYTELFRNKR